MVDILFLAKGRKEFTEASWEALMNSDLRGWPHDRVWVYTDGDLEINHWPDAFSLECARYGGPVACTNAHIVATRGQFIAKIDNDLILCPGWLEACLDVMGRHTEVDLLGLEPWAPDEKLWPCWVEPMAAAIQDDNRAPARPRRVSHVGGIGLFRRSAFERFGLPIPNSKDDRYGFTEWQWNNPSMVKAFLDPPLPVFLLDHLPFQPWMELGDKYETTGVQRRQWGFYDPIKHKALWDWWVTPSKGATTK
jgi:hypothetical protein